MGDICAVERVDAGAFQMPHVMQVVTRDGAGTLRTVYLQCKVGNAGGRECWGRSPLRTPGPYREPPPPRPPPPRRT